MRAFIAALGLLLLSLVCYAGDNQAYIDQAGGYASVYILQDGVGNGFYGIGGPAMTTNPAMIHGDGTAVNIQQIGSNDQLQFGIKTTSTPKPMGLPSCLLCPVPVQGNSWSYIINGNNAVGIIDSNNDGKDKSASNGVDINQSGDNAYVNVNIKGSYNTSTISTSGNYESVTTIQTNTNNAQSTTTYGGSHNNIKVTQSGTNGIILNNINGTANTVTVTQSDGGANGHSSQLDVSGNSNNIAVNQSGLTGDSAINLQMRGSNNNINFTSATR
jgi:hypothetical protein